MSFSQSERGSNEDLQDQDIIQRSVELSSRNLGFNCTEVRQNDFMTLKITSALLLLAIASPSIAAEPYQPWPTKDQLREIEGAAFRCSRENISSSCQTTRQLADPWMDHPRLPGICKDDLWKLMEVARVASENDYKRRDAIDQTARRMTRTCAKPVKKKAKPQSPKARA